ncbi:hypothetical protein J1N10_01330 [Carboxylicivirga sp. A043]|uniref:hypothetical protein n=1 Tax=Carboxylicivirga litoralis TaxID=2816963 RepID=UPI0021CB944E|nr:hypothetical protein [Carboxylicivirga sp. A043]MCU4154597.1 hypothetical protein [Carboxylicivirga sp. A043]
MKHQEAFDLLNEQLNDIPKAQIRSLSLAVLPRLMNALDENSEACPDCKKLGNEGEHFVRNIRPLFQQDTNATKQFEQWVEEAQKHLKIKHQQHVKGRLTSTYTTIGMAIGTLIAFGYIYLSNNEHMLGGISIGWAIGMLAGYIFGKVQERKLSQQNKLY